MKVVILAAGRGTRMKELSKNTPKPLLNINNKPKLAYTVEQLPDSIDEVVFVVGYLGNQIRDYFGDSYNDKKITYVEQNELNGTGGAVMLAKDVVGNSKFLVLMGDDLYFKKDLEKMFEYDFSALAYKVDDAKNYAVVKMDSEGYLENVIETPHNEISGFANTGAYVLSPEFFGWKLVPKSPGSAEFGLPQTLAENKGDIKIKVIKTDKWFPIGTPEALEEAHGIIDKFVL